MGIYIFSWKALKEALIKLSEEPGCDFGKHVIPYCFEQGKRIFAYEYNGYWKDVGTLGSYWEANMELICMRNTGRSTQRATVFRRSISLLTQRSQNVSSERGLRSTVR